MVVRKADRVLPTGDFARSLAGCFVTTRPCSISLRLQAAASEARVEELVIELTESKRVRCFVLYGDRVCFLLVFCLCRQLFRAGVGRRFLRGRGHQNRSPLGLCRV